MMKYTYHRLIALLCLLSMISSCTPLMENVAIGFKEPIQEGTITFTIRDYENRIPDRLSIRFSGLDTLAITNTLNERKFKITPEGRVYLAIGKDYEPSPERPLRFVIYFEAPGYTTYSKEFYLTSRQSFNYFARLGKIGKVQNAIWSEVRNFNSSESYSSNSTILIEADFSHTLGYGINQEPIPQRATVRLDYFGAFSRGLVPVGSISQLFDKDYKPLPYAAEIQKMYAAVWLQPTSNGIEWWSWKSASKMRMYLSKDGLANSLELSKKTISVIHYDEHNDKVRSLGVFEIQNEGNGSYIDFEAERSGYYVAADLEEICITSATWDVYSKYRDLDIRGLFRVHDVATNTVVKTFYGDINFESVVTVTGLPVSTKEYTLSLYDFTNFQGRNINQVFWRSGPIKNCVNTSGFIDMVRWDAPPAVELRVEVKCPNGLTFDESQLPAVMHAQFSKSGQEIWYDLATFTRSERSLKTYKLDLGETYDFRISTDGKATWPYREDGYKLTSKRWLIRILPTENCK